MFAGTVADDSFGLDVRREGKRIWFTYPVAVLVADVPGR